MMKKRKIEIEILRSVVQSVIIMISVQLLFIVIDVIKFTHKQYYFNIKL